MKLVLGAANYERMGEVGFCALYRLVRAVPAYALTYGRLDEAASWLDDNVR